MKENIIRGKYFEVDFGTDIIIQKTNEETIKELLSHIMHKANEVYMYRYNQGFLEITDPDLLTRLPKILEDLKLQFISNIIYSESLAKNITKFIHTLEVERAYDEELISYIWEIYDRFQTQMHYKAIALENHIIIKLINAQPHYLFELPSSVVCIVFESRPSATEVDILDAMSIGHIISNEPYKVGKNYNFRQYDIGLIPGLDIEDELISKQNRGKFQLGLSIHKLGQIHNANLVDPDYIIVEPEKAYIHASGVACLARRQMFYKKLFETFPDSDIMVTLPKLELLDVYFNQGNETALDTLTMMNHSNIYETELKAIFKTPHKHIFITIPDIENIDEFDRIRKFLDVSCRNRFGFKLKIGLEVNTEYVSTHLSLFKGFEYGIFNLNRCFEIWTPKEINNMAYSLQYSDLRSILYRKSKKTYLMGKDLSKPCFFEKLMYRGFRKFTIKPELFPLYSTIIYKYNQGERNYAKRV